MGEAEQMAYLATKIKEVRAESSYCILLDSGNWAKGTLLSDKFKGLPMAEILGALEYSAVGIGEGEIHFGIENMRALESEAGIPFVNCNIFESGTDTRPDFLKKFVIIEKGPFRIGIIGVSSPEGGRGKGMRVKDPFTVLPSVMSEVLEENPDFTVILSRLGFERDKALARAFPQTGIIVGGGDGENFDKPRQEGKTLIVQAGEKAQFLGSLSLDMSSVVNISRGAED